MINKQFEYLIVMLGMMMCQLSAMFGKMNGDTLGMEKHLTELRKLNDKLGNMDYKE